MGDPRCSAIVLFRIGVVQSSCITMGSCELPFQHPLSFTTVTEWSIEPQSCWVCVTCPRQKLWSACLEFGWFLFLFLFFVFVFVSWLDSQPFRAKAKGCSRFGACASISAKCKLSSLLPCHHSTIMDTYLSGTHSQTKLSHL